LSSQSLSALYFEAWVTAREDREKVRALARDLFQIAGPITSRAGGSGPWLFLTWVDAPSAKSRRFRKTLGVKPGEDLWMELAFFPSRPSMLRTVREMRRRPEFKAIAKSLDALVSKRPARQSTGVGIGELQRILE